MRGYVGCGLFALAIFGVFVALAIPSFHGLEKDESGTWWCRRPTFWGPWRRMPLSVGILRIALPLTLAGVLLALVYVWNRIIR